MGDDRSKVRREADRWDIWDRRIRDVLLFLAGLLLLLHETVASTAPRPTLVVAAMALLGVPFVMAADEKRRKKSSDRYPDEP